MLGPIIMKPAPHFDVTAPKSPLITTYIYNYIYYNLIRIFRYIYIFSIYYISHIYIYIYIHGIHVYSISQIYGLVAFFGPPTFY